MALTRPHLGEACAWLQSEGPGALGLRHAAERGAWRTQTRFCSFDRDSVSNDLPLPQKGPDDLHLTEKAEFFTKSALSDESKIDTDHVSICHATPFGPRHSSQ